MQENMMLIRCINDLRKEIKVQEAKNRLNVPLHETFQRGILKGVRSISDTV